MSGGAAEREQGARRAGKARIEAIQTAKGDISGRYGSARKEFEPIKALGDKAISYFDQYQTPGGFADIYKKYTATTDPLNKYYSQKSEEAINRTLAAKGKLGGGTAIEAQSEATTSLQAKMADLVESRVQSELGLQERMLDRGTGARTNIANLYTREGELLADLSTQEGAARGVMQEQIAGARAEGKQREEANIKSAAAITGGLFLGALAPAAAIGSGLPGGGDMSQMFNLGQQMGGLFNMPTGGTPIVPTTPTAPAPGQTATPTTTPAPTTMPAYNPYTMSPTPSQSIVPQTTYKPIQSYNVGDQYTISGNYGFNQNQPIYNMARYY